MALLERISGTFRRLVSRPVFVVEIRGGVARARAGEIPPRLLVGLSDVARDIGLGQGAVYGVRGRHGLTLDFSGGIPEHAHQRLRNVLALHRHQVRGG